MVADDNEGVAEDGFLPGRFTGPKEENRPQTGGDLPRKKHLLYIL
jgi:hypothetical protein